MSYILEALKKSDQERQIGHVPDISHLQEVPKQSAPRWPRWLLAALMLNAVILVVLAWRTWEARVTREVVEAPPVAAVPAPAAMVPTAPIPAAPTPIEAAPQLPEPVVQVPQPAPVEEVEHEVVPAPMPAPMPAPAPVPPVDVDTLTAPEAPPRWQDLPLEERTGLPVPRIDVHVFAQEPERRFVLINLRKYQVGDTLDDGTTLEAILNDGIVLSYRGRQYRVDRP
jgi:general secretion pathway protein B